MMEHAMKRNLLNLFFLSALFGLNAYPYVHAADWPVRDVKIVVPYPPGSSNDAIGRFLADGFQKKFGRTFIVENKPGASGSIGINEVARSKPDGYTILVVSNSMVTNLVSPSGVGYEVFRDFEPVSLAGTMPIVLVVNPELKIRTVDEFIAQAKAKPGHLKYGSSGEGSPHQLTMELFKSITGTDLLHVPYKGQAPILVDLLAGRIDAAFVTLGPAVRFIKVGKLDAIGMLGSERSKLAPDIPTLKELGVKGMDLEWWLGVFVPKGTDQSIVKQIAEGVQDLSSQAAYAKALEGASIVPVGDRPEQFSSMLKREIAVWKDVAGKIHFTEQK
ncbi:MAG: tripartite tricarboxylate transporter substrate binding protein [Burkholderiales bacterium]|nr:tripartite tricarboxylate transporter substrate binding protein [Burkholderiales bacterium]